MGEDGDHEPPPIAKRRRIMAPPEGFQVNRACKQLGPSIASFSSVFTTESDVSTQQPKPASTKRPQSSWNPTCMAVSEFNEVSMANERTLKPPILATPRQKLTPKPLSHKRMTPLTAYRPHPAPTSSPPTRQKLPTTRYRLRSPSPPTNKHVLKNLAPPSLPVLQLPRSTSPSKEMRTISSITPAPSSTAADLLSISLQQNHVLSSPTRSELTRGIHISPSKSDRNGKFKFVRNGHAERTSQIISRSHTALSLWQSETARQLTSSRRLAPDMRLSVRKIIRVSQANTSPTPYSGLALCCVIQTNDRELEQEQELSVLFSFLAPPSIHARISSAEDFEEDREVYVWKPWYSANVPNIQAEGGDQCHPMSGTTLLCSRFLFIRT